MVRDAVEHRQSALECVAERAMLRGLLGGCQVPIAACSRADGDARVTLEAVVATEDGSRAVRQRQSCSLPPPGTAKGADATTTSLPPAVLSDLHLCAASDPALRAAAALGASVAAALKRDGADAILGRATDPAAAALTRPVTYGKA